MRSFARWVLGRSENFDEESCAIDLPPVMDGQRGGAKDDRVMNRGAYLLSLLKLEARKRHLSWGG